MPRDSQLKLRDATDKKRENEIKAIVDDVLRIHYPDLHEKPKNDVERILISWWLYRLWHDKKNNREPKYPRSIDFKVKYSNKVKPHPLRTYEYYIHKEL